MSTKKESDAAVDPGMVMLDRIAAAVEFLAARELSRAVASGHVGFEQAAEPAEESASE